MCCKKLTFFEKKLKKYLHNRGYKWKDEGAKTVLCLSCYNYSDKKCSQLWNKINRYGI